MRHAISALSLLLLITAGTGSARAEEKPLTRDAAKVLFDKADRALNEAWAAVKRKLPEKDFNKLKEDQRSWVEYRDCLARSPLFTGAGGQDDLPLDAPEYLEAAAGLEDERSEWLKGLIHEWKDETLSGVYSDSRGGRVEVAEEGGHLYFSISVVRGPTSHGGDISGVAVWNAPIGWYSDKGIDKDKSDETNLSFVLRERKLEITGANTGYYLGARAYFDGSYVKVKTLDVKAHSEMVKAAKKGQLPEK
ncbi:lysozyme inhibitor LprI family protein [Prosthecobacter fluviatilis]|uniref:Lysozyme inhibitor LprI family protein n=1 Tax=Prosthecobacter fluviatilis TaxID=445931 RepID=A0ABW0KXJ2_9BACT